MQHREQMQGTPMSINSNQRLIIFIVPFILLLGGHALLGETYRKETVAIFLYGIAAGQLMIFSNALKTGSISTVSASAIRHQAPVTFWLLTGTTGLVIILLAIGASGLLFYW